MVQGVQDLESGWVWTRAVRKAAGEGYALLPADPTAAAAAQSTDRVGQAELQCALGEAMQL